MSGYTIRKISELATEYGDDFVHNVVSQLCAGYFTLAVKPLQIPAAALSSTQRKRIERFSKLDQQSSSYTVAAYLIAQFGKNYQAGNGSISGAELLSFAMNHIRRAQEEVGGQIVFLEMEHGNSKLAAFYGKCGFKQFGERNTVENGKPITYDQLFLFLK